MRIFFPKFNIRLYDKNSQTDYIFFLHQNQNIFFSNIGNQNIFLEKKHNPPLQVKWSFPNGDYNWLHYPWLFCYLYCDVCIIDQNKIYITKNNRKGSDNASYFYFLAGWLSSFTKPLCWCKMLTWIFISTDRKSKVTNTALDSIGKHTVCIY